jgi:hypothetical protein
MVATHVPSDLRTRRRYPKGGSWARRGPAPGRFAPGARQAAPSAAAWEPMFKEEEALHAHLQDVSCTPR